MSEYFIERVNRWGVEEHFIQEKLPSGMTMEFGYSWDVRPLGDDYEQVTRYSGITFGVSFAEAIEQIKSRKHTEFAHGLRDEYFERQREILDRLVEFIEDSQKAR